MNGSDNRNAPINERAIEHRVRVRTGMQPHLTDIGVRGHAFVADEPPALGGSDLGPTPYDLICAGLAACTTITLRMYADRKSWPLEEAIALVEHQRLDESDSEGFRDRFVVGVELVGELSDEQRAQLLEVAGKCPVHRTLAAGAVVDVGVE